MEEPLRTAMLERFHKSNEVLRGRKNLVVDDDARNVFAPTSLVKLGTLPILALTAKAMKGDREKCLNAGASD